uniref:PWWP domain-containing protein n=1 Tax=Picea sitchensis TaxID=3332 RepID=B8LQ11_PICSI|nr:unknown [Picea sitchensis]
MEHQTVIEGSDSERTESIDLGTYEIQDQNCLAPGRLLWARMDQSPWWPVQIVDEKTISQNCIFNDRIKGGVLARFYGSCIYAWVDPFAHVSQFQGSFKEKGSNLRAFQKALEEEMLLRSKIVKSSVEPNGKSKYSETSSQHNKSGDVNGISNVANVGKKIIFQSREEPAIKTSTRKRTKSEELERSRSQRKQREKAPSNEQDVTTGGSEKKLRQLKVMRHLGLAAPPDSPFNANSPVKIAA